MVDKQNMTYKQLIAQLRKAIKEQPELADKFVCLYPDPKHQIYSSHSYKDYCLDLLSQ